MTAPTAFSSDPVAKQARRAGNAGEAGDARGEPLGGPLGTAVRGGQHYAGLPRLRPALGRGVAVVPLLAGFSPPGFGIALAFLPTSAAVVAPFYLPPLALIVLAIAAARRASFRSS